MANPVPNQPSTHNLLTPLQKRFLQVFSQLSDQDQFYLSGGTALAEYYLGHRLSFDLDFFTGVDGLVQPVSFQLEKLAVKHDLGIRVIRRFGTFVELSITHEQETLKIDLALDSPFRFNPPIPVSAGIRVNDYLDLCTDKLLAYSCRAEPRDAVDLFCILQNVSADLLIEKAGEKDPGFDTYWFSIALNRCLNLPDEAKHWPVQMLIEWSPKVIKEKFQDWSIRLMEGLRRKS